VEPGQEVAYGYDVNGNVTSIIGPGIDQHLTFDSANRLVCIGMSPGGCGSNTIHYDVHGKRVVDLRSTAAYEAFVGDDFVYDTTDLNESASRIEVFAFGERVGMKAKDITTLRTSSDFALPWDRETLEWWLLLAGLGLVSYGFARGAFVLVARRPVTAGTAIVVAVTIAIPPVSWSGGGGGAVFYWELSDPLGTGMVLVDEDGARVRHKTFKPFGGEYAAVGTLQSERTFYAGHRRHDDSGLFYMQARWMDPNAGTFLSIDPLVPDAFDPQAVNAFSYARNNPVSNVDPNGMQYDCYGDCSGFNYENGRNSGPGVSVSSLLHIGDLSLHYDGGGFGFETTTESGSSSGGSSASTPVSGIETITVTAKATSASIGQFSYWNGTSTLSPSGWSHPNLTTIAIGGTSQTAGATRNLQPGNRASYGNDLGTFIDIMSLYYFARAAWSAVEVGLAWAATRLALWKLARGSIEDVISNPYILRGLNPTQLTKALGKVPGWRTETLGQGTHKGQGWLMREYTRAGHPTGRMVQWHPGGGHHGPSPYWRVNDFNTRSPIIPAGKM